MNLAYQGVFLLFSTICGEVKYALVHWFDQPNVTLEICEIAAVPPLSVLKGTTVPVSTSLTA